MPRLSETTKDVVSCEKLRGGANDLWSVDVRMGKPSILKRYCRKATTRGTETSKYPEEEKTIVIPQVVASERGIAQTSQRQLWGVVGLIYRLIFQLEWFGKTNHRGWKSRTSSNIKCVRILSSTGPVKSCVKLPAPSGKAKYSRETDSEPVLWRKGEKNPKKGSEKHLKPYTYKRSEP